MFAKENAVFAVNNIIKDAAIAVGYNGAATSKRFNRSNAERFKRGKNIAFSLFEIAFESFLVLERDEFNIAGALGEFDKIMVLRTFADNSKGNFEFHTGFNGEVEALPCNLP